MVNKVLSGISVVLCLIGLVLTVCAIFAPHWAEYEEKPGHDYEYNIFVISDEESDDPNEPDSTGMSGFCFEAIMCELEDVFDDNPIYEGNCKRGTMQGQSAGMYFFMNMVAFAIMTKYIVAQISIIIDRDPGNRWLILIESIFFPIISGIGFVNWWVVTEAGYDNDCEYPETLEDLMDGDPF